MILLIKKTKTGQLVACLASHFWPDR